jgi:DNA relaxase NicK
VTVSGFTQTIDWLAFTVPDAAVDDVIRTIGGDWFQSETGFRGYPVSRLTTQGRNGVGKLGTGAHRRPREVHVDLSAGIVSQWDEAKLQAVLGWITEHKGHVTRLDVALDDRDATVCISTIREAVDAGKAVTRSQKFQVLSASNHKEGVPTGETLYFGSRESQTMLRVYDKRLELRSKGREEADSYGVRWELEFKQDRAQACAKALRTLDAEDWRAFVVGLLRSYVDFRDTTREAEPYEKYRAALLPWWQMLTEGFRRCRLVVEKIQQRLDDVVMWLSRSIAPMLSVAVARKGQQFLFDLIYIGTKKWKAKHYALLKERKAGTPYVLTVS